MSEPRPRYPMTLADLRQYCRHLATIEVIGHSSSFAGCSFVKGTEELVGRNAAGEIMVRVKGKVTPGNVIKFRNSYEAAVAAGIIKPPAPKEISAHAPEK